jgi:hypothetical protein
VPDRAAIVARLTAEPATERHWLDLAAHLRDNGEDERATVVRGLWRLFAEGMKNGEPADAVLRFPEWLVRCTAWRIREAEERELRPTDD